MRLFEFFKRESARLVTKRKPTASRPDTEENPVMATHASARWQDVVPTSDRPIVSKGLFFVFDFLSLFFIWAVAAPISSAVIASGTVISSGQNKTIQHPVEGVVAQILVSDGESVSKGQTLLVLDESSAKAEHTRLAARHAVLSALKTRLTAGQEVFPSPEDLSKSDNLVSVGGLQLRGAKAIEVPKPDANALSALEVEQLKELAAARKRFTAELDAAGFLVESLREEGEGLKARLLGQQDLLNYSEFEINKIRPLVEDGIIAKKRLWDLDKTRLEQLSTIANLRAEVATNAQRIAEAEAKYERTEADDVEKRSKELTNVIGELAELKDQILAAQTKVEQTDLKAPADGTIVRMIAHTVGGVIEPGDVVAELVPQSSGQEVELRVQPADVDSVQEGQKARVIVTAFNRRTYAPIDAEISYVSADSTVDQTTGERYFTARAKLTPDPKENTGIAEIRTGMATEVYVLASSRVFLSYVLQPVSDSINKAFRQ